MITTLPATPQPLHICTSVSFPHSSKRRNLPGKKKQNPVVKMKSCIPDIIFFPFSEKVCVFLLAHLPAHETFLSVLWLCTSDRLATSPWQPAVSPLGNTYRVCVCVCWAQCSHSHIPLPSVFTTRVCWSVCVFAMCSLSMSEELLICGPSRYILSSFFLSHALRHALTGLLLAESFEVWHEN